MQPRFSKSALLDHMDAKVDALCAERGFTRGDGWAAVVGRPRDTVIAYGAVQELLELIDRFQDWGFFESLRRAA